MFASAEISARVEARRREEGEDFLVTRVVVLGLPITLGRHLYLDRAHVQWERALEQLLVILHREKEDADAARILLREFTPDADPVLTRALLDRGFIEVGMPDMMTLEAMPWSDRAGYIGAMRSRYRREVRREILPFLERIRVAAGPLTDPGALEATYALYRRVHARGRQLNVIALPENVFSALAQAPTFDVLRFYVRDEPGTPERLGAVMLSHVAAGRYSALLIGFDEALIGSHAIYKASLFLTVERAMALGADAVNLAFTAETIKKKVGARPRPTCAFALIDDTFGANILMNI